MSPTPANLQYRLFVQSRLHYSLLYWLSIAYGMSVALLLFLSSRWLDHNDMLSTTSGIVLVTISFIGYRLYRLECHYEQLIEDIESTWRTDTSSQVRLSPRSGRTGSRLMVCTGLLVVGSGLLVLAYL